MEHSDPKALYEAAHRLKSSSAQLGALATAAGCAKLETLGREAHLETAPALVQELVLGHQSTCQAIEMELRARTGH
ncbi:MAG: Hpt domain-containing protein [Nitrospira sp.]|nr:Hpt domain-containing protein [Nitrospira sp.]